MADRPVVTAMQIANALSRADSQQLAEYGFALLESLTEARALVATYQEAENAQRREAEAIQAARRERDAERKRRVRGSPSDRRGVHRKTADSLDGSPDPSLNPTSTPSSPRESLAWQPALEGRLAERLATDAGRNALTTILAKGGNKTAIVCEVGMVLDGGRPGVSRKPEDVELALCDYAANEERWNNALFRAYVQRAARGESKSVRRGGTGQRSHDNALAALRDLPETA